MKFVFGKNVLTSNGWETDLEVGINDDGVIGFVGPSQGRSETFVDMILPAATNLHSHSFQRAMAGLTEARGPDASDSFWTWRRLMYRFLDQLTPEQIEAIAAQTFMEMLEAGYAGVVEFHYLHHAVGGVPYDRLSELCDRIISAAETTGIGLTLLPVHYEFGGCDLRELTGGQLRFKNSFERYAQLYQEASKSVTASKSDFNIGVAPHSLRAVNPQALPDLIRLANTRPFHMHLAEQLAEVEEFQQQHNARPTEWILDNADIDSNWCLIHCTQMTSNETVGLARTGAIAGLCPITESSLGDGIFNGTEFLNHDGKFGIGSDSNVHVTLFDELKTLEYSQRLRDRSRAVLASSEKSTGRNLFDKATLGGSQAAQRRSGQVKEGYLADMVGLSTDNPWIAGRTGDTAIDAMMFGGWGQKCITDVWSAGRHVVHDGLHQKNELVTSEFKKVLQELGDQI